MNSSAIAPLRPLSRRMIAGWKPWTRGPEELLLECHGPPAARLVAMVHARWPSHRGHVRLVRSLPRHPSLRRVPFRSASGVDLVLDMTDLSFLHLSGRLPTEPLEVALMSRLVRPGDVFVDVGAHMGLYVAHLLGRVRPSGRVYAFEPSPTNAAFLRRTFGAPRDLHFHEAAVGETEGRARLVDEGQLTSKLSSAPGDGGIDVRLCRLDAVVEPPEPPAALVVKIDVEGFEAAVLRGAASLVRPGAPSAWLVESLPGEGARRAELCATLRDILPDAVVYGVSGRAGLLPIASVADDDPDTLNLLAVTPAMRPRMSGLGDLVPP